MSDKNALDDRTVAFSFGGAAYTVVDMVFIVLATWVCFWVIGDRVKTDKLYKTQAGTRKAVSEPATAPQRNTTAVKPVAPHQSETSGLFCFVVIVGAIALLFMKTCDDAPTTTPTIAPVNNKHGHHTTDMEAQRQAELKRDELRSRQPQEPANPKQVRQTYRRQTSGDKRDCLNLKTNEAVARCAAGY